MGAVLRRAVRKRVQGDRIFDSLLKGLNVRMLDLNTGSTWETFLRRHHASPQREQELDAFVGHLVAACVDHGVGPTATHRFVRLVVALSDSPQRMAG